MENIGRKTNIPKINKFLHFSNNNNFCSGLVTCMGDIMNDTDYFYSTVIENWFNKTNYFYGCKQFRFIFDTNLTMEITNIIAYHQFKANPIYYEEICRQANPIHGSRSTIQIILNDGLDLKVFHKVSHATDKRLRVYNIEQNFMPKYKEWLKSRARGLIGLCRCNI